MSHLARFTWLAAAGGALSTASLVLAAPAHALNPLTFAGIGPVVKIDTTTNLNTNLQDPACLTTNPDPTACPPNFGQGLLPTTDPLYTFGFGFDVTSPLTINALGVYHPDAPDYVYGAPHRVSLFQFTGTDYNTEGGDAANWSLVAGAEQDGDLTTPVACQGIVKDLFCWLPIDRTTLAVGKYRVSATGGWYEDYFADGGNVIAAKPQVTWTDGVFGTYTDPLTAFPDLCYTYPDTSNDCLNDRYPLWAANVSAEEVPAPLPVLGAAATFGLTRRLRRRIRLSRTAEA